MNTAVLPSVVEEILRYNADRTRKGVRLKVDRMSQSAFAFFRGTDHLFARDWPELRPADVGPALLICGDLHLENFGAYESDEGDFRFDVNDFDEALVAPCSLDLVRCGTSILLAAEEWGLSPVRAAGMVLAFLDTYRAAVRAAERDGRIGEIAPGSGEGPVWDLLGETAVGSRRALLAAHTKRSRNGAPTIRRRQGRHPAVDEERAQQVGAAIEAYGRQTSQPDPFKVLDVRGRIAGIGSLGVLRYSVLTYGGGPPDRWRLLDVKECRPSALALCTDVPQPAAESEATRVVDAQRQLQAKPCRGLAAIAIVGRPYRMREMVPDENRASLERLRKKPAKLRAAVEVVGQVVAWSHLRGARAVHVPSSDLADWTEGPALDAVLAAAVRHGDRVGDDYRTFVRAYRHRDPGSWEDWGSFADDDAPSD